MDHVIEVGGPGTLPQSIAAVAIGGHIALIGVLTGRAGEIATAHLIGRDPSRFVEGEQLGRRPSSRFILALDEGERLLIASRSMKQGAVSSTVRGGGKRRRLSAIMFGGQ